MSQQIDDKCYLGQKILERGFRQWFLYMFRVINGSAWKEENVHKKMFKQLQKVIDGQCPRLNFNICPRSGKTTLATYLTVFALTTNPKSQIIYTSFNQDLLSQIAQSVAAIMSHPVYQAMYPTYDVRQEVEEVDPIDDFWRDYLQETTGKIKFSNRKIYTPQGGVVLFNSVGAAITGFGCFDYNTLVATKKGKMKLGDIVENKLDVEVLSYNKKTKKKEYKKIYRYIKNDQSKYMKLVFDDGEIINCTPDHVFFTRRGELPAGDILVGEKVMANFFNFPNWYIKFCCYIATGVISVKNKINLLFCKRFFDIIKRCFATVLNSMTVCDFAPNNTTLNVRYRRRRYSKIFCNLFVWACVFGYLYCHFGVKFLELSVAKEFIVGVLLCCAVAQVLNSIVGLYRIYMSGLQIGLAHKCKKHKSVDKIPLFFVVNRKFNRFISFIRCPLFQKTVAFFRKHLTVLGDKITVCFRYREVVNVVNCNHEAPSYCLTLWDNNNLFVGKSQIFVHNCGVRGAKGFSGYLLLDDSDKPTDVRSEKIRNKTHTYFVETLLSRLNNPDTPIINIQQRLHLDDMSGFLADKYGFETFKAPLLDENGNCTLGQQYTPERIKELQVDNYTFSAQYQQEPIILGGGVIKHEWWRFYSDMRDQPYRRIFITADTAMKTKEWNDFTAIGVWGLTASNRLRLLDLVHGKFEIPELEQVMINLWKKWHIGVGSCRCSAIYIEDKASGTQLIQTLMRKGGLPILRVMPEKDKYTRVMNAIPQLAAGNVELPNSDIDPISKLVIDEADAFTADDSHLHDDIIDIFCYATDVAFNARGII